jgi:hypothetical protein
VTFLPLCGRFGNLAEDVIRERQQALETYMTAVLKALHPLDFGPLGTFLDVHRAEVRVCLRVPVCVLVLPLRGVTWCCSAHSRTCETHPVTCTTCRTPVTSTDSCR